MKLNKKGYMLVEIIISFAIAMSIMFYLINLTYKFKNTSEDIYQSTLYLKDKVSITKNIMNDLERGKIISLNDPNKSGKNMTVDFALKLFTGPIEKRRITIEEKNGKITIYYGKWLGNSYEKKDISYYEKILESSLIVKDIVTESTTDKDSLSIELPLSTLYTNELLNIKLFLEKDNIPVIKQVTSSYNQEIWKYKDNTTKIIFQDSLNPIPGAIETFDISSLRNNSVMAYVVPNGDGTYTTYIQGKNKIYTNSDSSYLFYNFTKLETIENLTLLDTSMTDNMESIFEYCDNLLNINVSNFNTSNVTNMKSMFSGMGELTSLDISNFDTRNVTNMSHMFERCLKLKALDLSHFDTSNVDDMSYMFDDVNLEPLNLCNFDTKKVTKMIRMFSHSGYRNIYVGDNWIVNDDTDTRWMYETSYVSDVTRGQC